MTVLFWVLISVAVSAVAIPASIWGGFRMAKKLYVLAQGDADYRLYQLSLLIQQVAPAPDEVEKSEEEQEKELRKFWVGVADIIIARMIEKQAKSDGGKISQTGMSMRQLLDLGARAKEDPQGVFKELMPSDTF